MPFFGLYAVRSNSQVQRAAGFLNGSLLPDANRVFWTMTAWDAPPSMRTYMLSGAHKAAMPKLMHWCDEASVAHWEQEDATLPSWSEADQRMRTIGRISKVRHPSPQHAGLNYAPPKPAVGFPIEPV